jgi:hypothetical protein
MGGLVAQILAKPNDATLTVAKPIILMQH